MKTIKKTLAIVLTLCMVCAFVVPAVSAESEPVTYMVGEVTDRATVEPGTLLSDNAAKGLTFLAKGKDTYKSNVYVNASYGNFMRVTIPADDDAADEAWVALKLSGVKAGNYTVSMKIFNQNSVKVNGAIFDCYVIPYTNNVDIAAELARKTTNDRILTVDCFENNNNSGTNQKVVNFANDGDYVIICKLAGKNAGNTGAYRCFLTQGVILTPSEGSGSGNAGGGNAGGGNDQPPKTGYTLIAPVVACILSGAAVVVCSKKKEN